MFTADFCLKGNFNIHSISDFLKKYFQIESISILDELEIDSPITIWKTESDAFFDRYTAFDLSVHKEKLSSEFKELTVFDVGLALAKNYNTEVYTSLPNEYEHNIHNPYLWSLIYPNGEVYEISEDTSNEDIFQLDYRFIKPIDLAKIYPKYSTKKISEE